MRAFSAAGSALLTLALGLALAKGAGAQTGSDCQLAFEKWAAISTTRVVPRGSDERGGCIPSEEARRDLLEGLSRARAICAEVTSTDQSIQQTRTMLYINQNFINGLGICPPSDTTTAAAGSWSAKATANPLPPPPPPQAAAPLPAPPRPAVIPPPAAPKTAAAAPPPTPPCIEMSRAQNDSYALVNRRCSGHTVLAVVETRSAKGEIECRAYTVNHSLAVPAPTAPPRINYECVASQATCNKDRLGDMFPECEW
jgi:hypothetical protein